MIEITTLERKSDARGFVVFPELDRVRRVADHVEMHCGNLLPGGVRGNHRHTVTHEQLLVMHEDRWTLTWREHDGVIHRRTFAGPGAESIDLPPGIAHALTNDGAAPLYFVSIWSGPERGAADVQRDPLT
jgi:oxalate decarboxylase/phosphoglucose isomerase-like protein (cupin superfamily)